MNEQHHDQAIEQAIERLTILDPASSLTALPSSEASDLERSYAEVLGLLAFADAPQMPNAGIKSALLEQVASHPRSIATPRSVPAPVDLQASVPQVSVPQREVSGEATVRTIRPLASPWSPWSIAMAAMLGICVIGLAFLAGRVREQRQQIGALQQSVLLSSELAEQQNQLVAEQLRHNQQHLEMITEVARQVYLLRTVDG